MILLLFTPYATGSVDCLFDGDLFDAVIFDTCVVVPPVGTGGHPGWKVRRIIGETDELAAQNEALIMLLS